ncbi:MAG TPA: hypothetical protein VNT60_09550, partial [Deinococcales bacterium]|nr:hypothetical protein [Deinococcales bacterium]
YLERPRPAPGAHLITQVEDDEAALDGITALLAGHHLPAHAPTRLRHLDARALTLQRALLERRLTHNRAALERLECPAARQPDGPHLARLPGLRVQCREGKVERAPRTIRLELTRRAWHDLGAWRLEAKGTPRITRALYLLRGDGRLVAYAASEHRAAFARATAGLTESS